MKAPRTIIYLICLYCLISAVVYMTFSILAILSYACQIDLTGGEFRYMMYLMYFRLPQCDESPNWSLIGISTATVQPVLPATQSTAVLKTFIFSIVYLSLNFILFLTIFRTLAGIHQRRNKHIIFWSYFSPLFIVFILIIAVDFIASAIYIVDFFLLWFNSDRVMELLEVTNSNDQNVISEFTNLSQTTRSLPSMLIFLATSKVLVLLTFNCSLIYVYFVAAWKVCRKNQKVVFKVTKPKKSKKKEQKISEPVEGSTIHRIESSTTPNRDQPKIKKNERPKKTKKTQSNTSRDETELPTIYQIETPTSSEVSELNTATVNKVEKVKEEKNVKPANDELRDVTELPEYHGVIPRITYQKQPSQEEIPLPPPPSFNNKRTQKTKF